MMPSDSVVAPAIISVVDHNLPYDTHNFYYIKFDSHTIRTLITSSPSIVDSWLFQIPQQYSHQPSLLVGLDTEQRLNFKRSVATLQLCIGQHCLIFQIFHARSVPASLAKFLSDPNHTFFGVGIQDDADKLLRDCSLRVANCVDLRALAADVMGDHDMRNAGLKTLCKRVIGWDIKKLRKITMSKWDDRLLSLKQVQYVAVDAYVSSKIGLRLQPAGCLQP